MTRRNETGIPLSTRTQWMDAPVPTRTTVFFRTCILWQILRFAAINLKMMVIIAASHKSGH